MHFNAKYNKEAGTKPGLFALMITLITSLLPQTEKYTPQAYQTPWRYP